MIKTSFLLFMLFILQACQVNEELVSSKQVAENDFENPQFTVFVEQDEWKILNDTISVSLSFPYDLQVTGTPTIEVDIGGQAKSLSLISGNGSRTLVFSYTISATDYDEDGVEFENNINLNSGSISYVSSLGVSKPAPTFISIPDVIKVDGIVPTILAVTAPSNGFYKTNDYLNYSVSFSEKISVSGNPAITLILDSSSTPATYKSGSGTSTLQFSKRVLSTDNDNDGFSTDAQLNLNATYGINILDEAGNALDLAFPITNSAIFINTSNGPYITSISTPAAATYIAGSNIDFTVVFSSAVNVTGTPAFPIALTLGNASAKYLSGSGTNTLIFRYTVVSNELDLDGIILQSPMLLKSGSILSVAGSKPAILTHLSPITPTTTGVIINSVQGPVITKATGPIDKTYIAGDDLEFSLTFNRPVTVSGGTPDLTLSLSSGSVTAAYIPGSSTATKLVFKYTVQANDNDLDGVTLPNSINLNGATIQDASLYNALLSFPGVNTGGVKIDALAPTIVSVSAPASKTYKAGEVISLNVLMSEPVSCTGVEYISLTFSSGTKNATCTPASGSTSLTFSYSIIASDLAPTGTTVASTLSPSTGSITDLAGNALTSFAFTAPVATSVIIDNSAPTISSFISTTVGNYPLGTTMIFRVNWSEDMAVTGVPRLALDFNGITVYANYHQASSSPTTSYFHYTIKSGDLDLDGVVISGSLDQTIGQFTDIAGNATLASLPPLTPLTLTTVLVDGIKPTITSVTIPSAGSYGVGDLMKFKFHFDDDVNVNYAPGSEPIVKIKIGDQIRSLTYVSGNGTITLNFEYNIQSGDLDSNGIEIFSTIELQTGSTIEDINSNSADLSFSTTSLAAVHVDGVSPVPGYVEIPELRLYKLYETIDFIINWSETTVVSDDGSNNYPYIELDIGGVAAKAFYHPSYNSDAKKTVFRYTVQSGHLDLDGISMLPASPADPLIYFNGGNIADLAGNSATQLSYTRRNLSGILIDGVRPVITGVSAATNVTKVEGQTLSVSVTFSDTVYVTGNPQLPIQIGTGTSVTTVLANYSSGDSSNTLIFDYIVQNGDEDLDGIKVLFPIQLGIFPEAIFDINYNNAILTYTDQLLSTLKVDAKAPQIISASTSGDYFKPGNVISYKINYHEPITLASGTPTLSINVGGTPKTATCSSVTGNTLNCNYTVDSSNTVLDLDGISVTPTINLNSATIQDNVFHNGATTFTFSEKDYVYYSNILARYNFENTHVTTATCNGVDQCITAVTDLSGNGKNITSGTNPGPKLVTGNGIVGFGTQLTSYAQFNNQSYLYLPSLSNIKYYVVVMKHAKAASVSTTATPRRHSIISFGPPSSTNPTKFFYFESTSSTKSTNFYTMSKFNKNNLSWGSYWTSFTSPIWAADTTATYGVSLLNTYSFTNNSSTKPRLGDFTFDGQIAEIIFLGSSSSLSEAQINKIREQLNTTHGAY